jgi:hypothetical protein
MGIPTLARLLAYIQSAHAKFISDIHIRLVLYEKLDQLLISKACRHHQRSLPVLVQCVRVRSVIEEKSRNLDAGIKTRYRHQSLVPRVHCRNKGRDSILSLCTGICSKLQKPFDHCYVLPLRGIGIRPSLLDWNQAVQLARSRLIGIYCTHTRPELGIAPLGSPPHISRCPRGVCFVIRSPFEPYRKYRIARCFSVLLGEDVGTGGHDRRRRRRVCM